MICFNLSHNETKISLKWIPKFDQQAGKQEEPPKEIEREDSMEGKGGTQKRKEASKGLKTMSQSLGKMMTASLLYSTATR